MSNNKTIKLTSDQYISAKLSPYLEAIRSSQRPYIRIKAKPAQDVPTTASKFTGKPYWPIGKVYPLDESGHPMMLLAQINFSETPRLNNYPEQGILQFFISANSDTYGADFNQMSRQNNFRVIFHDSIDFIETDSSIPSFNLQSQEIITPITTEHLLTFSEEKGYVSIGDVYFREVFGQDFYSIGEHLNDDNIWDEYNNVSEANGHKIGGYAYFTQHDPRDWKENADYIDALLLLQIDSEGDHILWGDVGVCNFFINKEDLHALDFSKVLYNWDCF
ncbi:YwqG family protein [Spirosoma jeollabukense]